MASTREAIERQPVEEGGRRAAGLGGRHVVPVGGQDVARARAYCRGGVAQGAVFCLGRSERKRMRGGAGRAPDPGHDIRGIGFAVRSSMRLRLSIRTPRTRGKLAAGDDHVVAMNNRRTPRSAEQAQDILRIASGDQDRLARVVADKAAPDLGRAGIADQDAIAAREITLDPRHAGGQQALAIRDGLCCSGIDMQGTAWL